jgi:flagellin
MALSSITLTAGMRANLLSLQSTSKLFDTTQTRLATGKKVNTALDDPINYFAAKAYSDRANDLSSLKDSMNEAIQIVKAADSGITAIEDLLSQAKSVANSALSTSSTTERSTYAVQFNNLLDQITDLAQDASYKGTNLLQNDSLQVNFNEDSSNFLTITGFSAEAGSTGLAIADAAGYWATDANVNTALDDLDDASGTLRTQSKTLSSNLAVVNTRLQFTSNMMSTLSTGSDNLTLADMNEEGANMLMLQTRQSLGVTALSLSSQAAQAILRLF